MSAWGGAALLLVILLSTTLAPGAQAQTRAPSQTPERNAGDPLLVPWQRTLEAALELSAQSGRPLLVCVNADGEVASDSLAARRYRDPEFVKLMEGFVPVIASAFPHTPRSHDGRGRRIPCPRFGTVTCEEHIALEPLAYERWFSGRRVAPRHVGIDADGKVMFDLYLLPNLGVIDSTLRTKGQSGKRLPDPKRMSERQLLDSPDARADERLEKDFLEASESVRVRMTSNSLDDSRAVQHPELVRLGLRDPSALVRRAAAERAAAHASLLPPDVLDDAARILQDNDMLVALITDELSGRENDAEALKRGLLLSASREPSDVLDVERWSTKLEVTDDDAPEAGERALSGLTVRLDKELSTSPDDLVLRSQLARAWLDLSRARLAAGESDVNYLLDLALLEARRVVTGDVTGDVAGADIPADARAVLARTDWLLGADAADAAPQAARALPGLFGEARSRLAAETLDVLVQARAEQTFERMAAGELPDAAWLADIAAGATLIVQHPRATAWQRAAALDVLGSLRLDGLHTELTWLGVSLDPASPELHEHLRWHLLRDGDAADVAAAYEDLLATVAEDQQATVRWYAAFARLQAGDRLRGEGRTDEAVTNYRASLEGFRSATSLDESLTNTADYIALAHCGLARILLDQDDPLGAAEELLAGLESTPHTLDVPDSLGVTPRRTTAEAIARLAIYEPEQRKSTAALAARLEAVLGS